MQSLRKTSGEMGVRFCVVYALKGNVQLCQLYADRLNEISEVSAADMDALNSDNSKVVRATLEKLLGSNAMEAFGGAALGRSELYSLAKGVKSTFTKGAYTR